MGIANGKGTNMYVSPPLHLSFMYMGLKLEMCEMGVPSDSMSVFLSPKQVGAWCCVDWWR